MRMHGQGSDRYEHVRIGMNSRLDTIQAAILIEKLKIFADEIELRNAVAERYNDAFASSNRIVAPAGDRRRDIDLGAIHDSGGEPRQVPGRSQGGGRADRGLLPDPAVPAEGLCPFPGAPTPVSEGSQQRWSACRCILIWTSDAGPDHRGGAGKRGLKRAFASRHNPGRLDQDHDVVPERPVQNVPFVQE